MRSVFQASLLAGAMGAAIMLAPSAAPAAGITIGFDVGNVAFAYSDGYWDHNHHWHRWHNHHERYLYMQDHADNYHGWVHTRDRDHGWHDDHH